MEWNLRPSSLWEWDNLFELDHKKSLAAPPANHDFSSGGGISSGDTTASSVSASMTSSSFGDSKPFTLDGFEPVPPRAAKQPESSSSPAEPFLSLKLGKRLYFKDLCTSEAAATNTTTGDADVVTAAKTPATSSSAGKRTKPLSCPNGVAAPPRCQVEGCNLDLSSAKDYHRKHRICEHHSKSPRVIVAGVERRFCQQCSRFHGLSEFDEKKRSCRRRLSDHNARRRKPQPEAVRLNPSRFSSIYDEPPPKMNLMFDQSPRLFAGNFAWDQSGAITTMPSESSAAKSGHKREYTGFAAWDHGPKAVHHTKEYLSRQPKPRQILFPGSQSPGNIASTSSATMLYPNNAATNKSAAPEFLHPAMEESELNASQDLHRALSLLSANSWGSRETKPVQQHLAPLASSELWESEPANLSLPRGSGNAANFQDLQLFRPGPNDSSGFYSSYQFN